MEWYQGGIAEAVTLSRQNGAIFLVYIEGKDDKSNVMTSTINSPVIAKMLSSGRFVAVHVDADSIAHKQFSEIYKHSAAPSIFFIGKLGVPLEIVTDAFSVQQMVNKINDILVKNGDAPLEVEVPEEIKPEPQQELVTDNMKAEPQQEVPPVEEPPLEEPASSSHDPTTSIEEKLRIAQELIASKRLQKEEEEKEKERNKEMERRKLGQDVQKMKRWQQDEELKQMMAERQRAKREDDAARDRVRRQIEEDKREKAARMNSMLPQQPVPETPRISVRATHSDTTRLQFRLPNGSQVTQDFKSTACLQEVIDYIKSSQCLANFILSTTFPKREFTTNDASQTLVDLELVPNAAMLVLPSARGGGGSGGPVVASGGSSGGFLAMIWYVLTPILSFFDYVKSFIVGAPRPPATTNENNKRPAAESASTTSSGPSGVKRRVVEEARAKRFGNIHRLHEQDSDDDNNTWNGNSTQQM